MAWKTQAKYFSQSCVLPKSLLAWLLQANIRVSNLGSPACSKFLWLEGVLRRCKAMMPTCTSLLAYRTVCPAISSIHLDLGTSLAVPSLTPCGAEDLIHLSLGHPELQMKSESCRRTAPGRIMHPVSYCSHYGALQYIIGAKHHPNDALV